MSRGFASGLLWGGVVSVLGLGVVSLVGLPPANTPQPILPEQPQTPAAPATNEPAVVDNTPVAPVAEPVPSEPEAEVAEQPVTPDVAPPVESTTPPLTSDDLPASLPEPAPAATPGVVAPDSDTEPATPSVATAPEAPEDEPAPGTVELLPPPPLTPEEESLLQPPQTALVEEAPAEIVPEPILPQIDPATPVEPEASAPALPEAEPPTMLPPDPGLPPAAGRLPQIGGDTFVEPEPDSSVLPDAGSGPIRQFARAFDNPDNKPMFAVLLVDSGAADLDRAQLAALPFPVTFILDPSAPGASDAEAIYRQAGQEVVMLATGIPAGATAADLEQTFQANGASLPQAVAVADLSQGGFQDNRPLATLVVPVIGAQGRGLVTFDRGLNAADQVARREGVPSARIFRRLDAEGEGTPMIRRYLDRAAFKAAQEGRVAVLGETRPETVQALLEWAIEGRGAQVAMAPLTAILSTD